MNSNQQYLFGNLESNQDAQIKHAKERGKGTSKRWNLDETPRLPGALTKEGIMVHCMGPTGSSLEGAAIKS